MEKKSLLVIIFFLILPVSALAQDKIFVAVEETYISAFKEMAVDFEAQTGVKVEATFSSAYRLYTQIRNGVHYDIFLAEGERWPDLLHKEGWTEGTFIYARGRTVLWSADKDFCKAATWQDALQSNGIKKIALDNPLTVSYGVSAKTALQKSGLWDALREKLVDSVDSTQSFPAAGSPVVDAGFCVHSAAARFGGKTGCYYEIPEAPMVVQAGCVFKKAKNKICSELFVAFLLSDRAAGIRKKYGYR